MSFNNATLIGRLTKTPELQKTLNTGKSVCSFKIAVDRDYTGKDGNRKTDFFPVVVWGNGAEFVSKYFSKGQWIGANGHFEIRDYTDKEGIKRSVTELIADRCFFVGDKQNDTTQQEEPSTSQASVEVEDYEAVTDSSDLPF